MKLWIDDFRLPPDDTWTWAKTFEEAMQHVTAVPYSIEEISFDHDLGMKWRDNDGWFRWRDTQPVAKWFEDEAQSGRLQKMPVWFIHSMNPEGRRALLATLRRAEKYIEDRQLVEQDEDRRLAEQVEDELRGGKLL